MADRSRGVVLSFLYWSLRRLLELVVLLFRSEREKEIEILLLRHLGQLGTSNLTLQHPQLGPIRIVVPAGQQRRSNDARRALGASAAASPASRTPIRATPAAIAPG